MREYHFKYYRGKSIVIILALFVWIIILLLTCFIIKNERLLKLFEENIILTIIIFITICTIIIFFILNFGLKIFSKDIHIIMTSQWININNDEKSISINNINELEYKIISHALWKITTGYELKIKYNNNEKNRMIIFTGTSEEENNNCTSFLEFYNELNRAKNEISPHCI